MAEDGEGEPGAGVVLVDAVLDGVQVQLDAGERRLQLHVEAGVVEGAVLDLPVGAGVLGDALLQGGDRLVAVGGQGMQLPVTAASLEEAEEAGTGRYHWLEHEVSIRCGGRRGNGISVAGVGLVLLRRPGAGITEGYRLGASAHTGRGDPAVPGGCAPDPHMSHHMRRTNGTKPSQDGQGRGRVAPTVPLTDRTRTGTLRVGTVLRHGGRTGVGPGSAGALRPRAACPEVPP